MDLTSALALAIGTGIAAFIRLKWLSGSGEAEHASAADGTCNRGGTTQPFSQRLKRGRDITRSH